MYMTDIQFQELSQIVVTTMNISFIWGGAVAVIGALIFSILYPIFRILISRVTAPFVQRALDRCSAKRAEMVRVALARRHG